MNGGKKRGSRKGREKVQRKRSRRRCELTVNWAPGGKKNEEGKEKNLRKKRQKKGLARDALGTSLRKSQDKKPRKENHKGGAAKPLTVEDRKNKLVLKSTITHFLKNGKGKKGTVTGKRISSKRARAARKKRHSLNASTRNRATGMQEGGLANPTSPLGGEDPLRPEGEVPGFVTSTTEKET